MICRKEKNYHKIYIFEEIRRLFELETNGIAMVYLLLKSITGKHKKDLTLI